MAFNEISLLQDFSLYVTGQSFISINQAIIENGTEKSKNTGNRWSSGLYPFVLERWDGRPDVPVSVLALALRALLVRLVWPFCMVNFGWSGAQSRLLVVEFPLTVVNCRLVHDLKMAKHGRNMSSTFNQ